MYIDYSRQYVAYISHVTKLRCKKGMKHNFVITINSYTE